MKPHHVIIAAALALSVASLLADEEFDYEAEFERYRLIERIERLENDRLFQAQQAAEAEAVAAKERFLQERQRTREQEALQLQVEQQRAQIEEIERQAEQRRYERALGLKPWLLE